MNQKGKGQDGFQTPKYIFDQLNNVFNFTLDLACNSTNKLCDKGFCFDLGQDALIESWGGVDRYFCNPPFSKKSDWIEKAHDEVLNGDCNLVVMILPSNSMDSKAFHKYVFGKFHYEILEGRISFIDPETNKPAKGNNSGTVIIYFKKKIKI